MLSKFFFCCLASLRSGSWTGEEEEEAVSGEGALALALPSRVASCGEAFARGLTPSRWPGLDVEVDDEDEEREKAPGSPLRRRRREARLQQDELRCNTRCPESKRSNMMNDRPKRKNRNNARLSLSLCCRARAGACGACLSSRATERKRTSARLSARASDVG